MMSDERRHDATDGLYRCDICGFFFRRDEGRETHEAFLLHNRRIISYGFVCDVCDGRRVECAGDGKIEEGKND